MSKDIKIGKFKNSTGFKTPTRFSFGEGRGK